jgi:hypothetical protein
MALTVRSQCIDMFPLQGGFVDLDVGGAMVRDAVDVGSLHNTASLGADLVEGRLLGHAAIGKEAEQRRRVVQRLVALTAIWIHLLVGLFPRRFTRLPDVMDEALHQILMPSLVTMIDKTSEIAVGGRLLETFELIQRGIVDQRGIIFDTLVGDFERGQQRIGKMVYVADVFATMKFTCDVTGATIFRFVLERCHGTESGRILSKRFELVLIRRAELRGYDGCQTLLCMGERLPDGVLPQAVSGHPQAVLLEVLHQCAAPIEGFCRHLGCLTRLC